MPGKEQTKKQVAETIWLNYFNERLFAQGLIDERIRNKLRLTILAEGHKT